MFADYRFAGGPAIIRWYEIRNTGLNDVEAAATVIHGRRLWQEG
jgi:hypothetical protein